MAKRKFYYVTILALLVTTTFASFIKKKSEKVDEKVTEFEMEITEHGTNFTQKMTFDEKNGLVIFETPSHNGRVATKFIYDTTNGLMLEVCDEDETAEFHRSFVALNFEHQKKDVESWVEDNDVSDDRFELKATPENTFKLINIQGPDVDIQCVPEKYRGFIPKGYRIYLAHQVQPLPGNVYNRGNESQFTVFDPISQKKYDHGDDVSVIQDVFNDILPPCAFKPSKRVKREYQCMDAQNNVVTRCTTRIANCDLGCDTEYTGWDCTNIKDKCHYVLTCPHGQGYVNQACINHINHADNRCVPCCRVRDCGPPLQACQYIPDDDICPAPGAGCPLENVETRYLRTKSRRVCTVDDVCDGVMDSSGDIANSGINCRTRIREGRQKIFCCNRRGTTANLLICDDLDNEN